MENLIVEIIVVAFEKIRFWYPFLLFSGSKEETRLLQNPPCESRQSLLTSFVLILQVLERHHLGSSQSKRHSCFEPTQWGWICLQHWQKQQKIATINQGTRLNVHTLLIQPSNRKQLIHYCSERKSKPPPFRLWLKTGQEACLDSGTIYHMKGLSQTSRRLK